MYITSQNAKFNFITLLHYMQLIIYAQFPSACFFARLLITLEYDQFEINLCYYKKQSIVNYLHRCIKPTDFVKGGKIA